MNEQVQARNMSAKTMKGPYLDVEGHKTGRSYVIILTKFEVIKNL